MEPSVQNEDTHTHTHTHFVRACPIEMHVDTSQEQFYTEICRKNAAAQMEPRTRTHALCENAQSKHTSTFHNNHFIRQIAGTHFVRACAVETHATCHKSIQEPFYTEIYRKNAAAQMEPRTRTHTYLRACAVEMRVNISQEQTYTEIYRKNAAAQLEHPDEAPAFTPIVRTPRVDTPSGEMGRRRTHFNWVE